MLKKFLGHNFIPQRKISSKSLSDLCGGYNDTNVLFKDKVLVLNNL